MPAFTGLSRRAVLAGLGAVAGASALPLRARAATEWILSSGYPEDSHQVRTNRLFAEALATRTEGEFTMDVMGNAALFALPQTKRAVQTNQVQFGDILLAAFGNEEKIYDVDAIPFLITSPEEAAAMWEVQRPLVADKFANQGILLLHGVIWPGQSLFSTTPVETLADLAGMKFRVQTPATARLGELMEVTGVRVETADVPQAFLTDMINGMFTSNATGMNLAVWDFCNYIYETEAWMPKNVTFMNLEVFEGLPQEVQDIILEESANAQTAGWAMVDDETTTANAKLTEEGVNVLKPSDALMEEFREIGDLMVSEWIADAGDEGAALIDAYRSKMS